MYLFLCIVGGIFCVLTIIALVLGALTGFEEPVLGIAFLVCLAIAIPCCVASEDINADYTAEIPQDAVLVVSNIYEYNDEYIRVISDPNQSEKDWCAHGTRTIIETVEKQVVLEKIMDLPAPSMNQVLIAEKLATECGVELPSSMIVPEA